jgi:hypothetical protein
MRIIIKNIEFLARRISNKKPKVWSRKGICPGCGVTCGSKHSKNCDYFYLAKK